MNTNNISKGFCFLPQGWKIVIFSGNINISPVSKKVKVIGQAWGGFIGDLRSGRKCQHTNGIRVLEGNLHYKNLSE